MVANNSLGAIAAVVAGGMGKMHIGQFPVQDDGFYLFRLTGRVAAKHRFGSYPLRRLSGLVECHLTVRCYGDLALLAIGIVIALEI